MICPTCERETAAVSELGEMSGARMRKRCAHPDCKAALPEEKPARAAASSTLDPILAEVPPVGSAPKPAPANGAPPSLAQTLAAFEARLPYVRDRIAELRAELWAYESEEKQIVLILTAAGRTVKEVKPS